MAKYPRGGYIPLSYHQVMLDNATRTDGFRKAIDYTVREGDVVLEVGGGTGILSMFAASKARKVYTVEYSEENAEACRRFVALNGFADKIEVICADAREYVPPEPIDVVICEMLHVALVDEQQVGVLNALLRTLRTNQARMPKMIPFAAINACQLVQYDFTNWGFQFPFTRFIQPGIPEPRMQELSDPQIYWKVDFYQENREEVSEEVILKPTSSGSANALRFVMRILLDDRLLSLPNDWYINQMIVPLPEPIALEAGVPVRIRVEYRAGCELSEVKIVTRTEASTPTVS